MELPSAHEISIILNAERSFRRAVRRCLLTRQTFTQQSIYGDLIEEWFAIRMGQPVPFGPSFEDIESILSRGIDGAGIIHETLRRSNGGAHGVIYTPPFIARTLAAEVLPSLAGGGACLDPACGCGILLVEVFRLLAAQSCPMSMEAANDLLDRMHGWDIDPAAVAIARRNLITAAWETLPDRNEDGLAQLRADNVRVGNALDSASGAFRAIVGNPPFIPEEGHRALHASMRKDVRWKSRAEARMDYGQYFLHLGLDLLDIGGRLAFILPATWRTSDGARKLRDRLQRESDSMEMLDLSDLKPFPDTAPGQQNMLLSLHKRTPLDDHAGDLPGIITHLSANTRDPALRVIGDHFEVRQGIVPGPDVLTRKAMRQFESQDAEGFRQWRDGCNLLPGAGVFVLTPEELSQLSLTEYEASLAKPFYRAMDLKGESITEDACRFLLYLTRETAPDPAMLPNILRHLERFRPLLERRRETMLGMRAWYHLHWPRERALFEGAAERLFVVRQCLRVRAVWTDRPAYVDVSCNVIVPRNGRADLRTLAAQLNGDESNAWFRANGKTKGDILQIDGGILRSCPLKKEDL